MKQRSLAAGGEGVVVLTVFVLRQGLPALQFRSWYLALPKYAFDCLRGKQGDGRADQLRHEQRLVPDRTAGVERRQRRTKGGTSVSTLCQPEGLQPPHCRDAAGALLVLQDRFQGVSMVHQPVPPARPVGQRL